MFHIRKKLAFIFIKLIFMINLSLKSIRKKYNYLCINLMLHLNKGIFNIDAINTKKIKIRIFLSEIS